MYRNHEGYPDPTVGAVMSKLGREEKQKRRAKKPDRPIVYICSSYAGDVEKNTEAARAHCRFAVRRGCIPLAVHLLFPQFMDDEDPEQRKKALSFGLTLMDRCDEVWVFGKKVSKGMAVEMKWANRRGYVVRRFE